MSTTFRLPVPPSINNSYRNITWREQETAVRRGEKLPGRIKTRSYAAWLKEAGWLVRQQAVPHITGQIEISIRVGRTRSDIDNLLKALLDMCVAMQVIDDDRFVERLSIERDKIDGVELTIRQFRR